MQPRSQKYCAPDLTPKCRPDLPNCPHVGPDLTTQMLCRLRVGVSRLLGSLTGSHQLCETDFLAAGDEANCPSRVWDLQFQTSSILALPPLLSLVLVNE